MGKKFLIDAEKCTSCQLCVIACKDEHVGATHAPWTGAQPMTGHFWIDVKTTERGRIPRVKMQYLPLLCQHCENAACIKVCPQDAIGRRADGLVWIDENSCDGCGLCQPACPYDVIYMNAELGVAQKCTGCAHRVDEGALPRCADVCPHDVILFVEESDLPGGEVHHPEFLAAPRVLWRGLPQPFITGAIVDAASDEVLPGTEITVTDLFADGVFRAVSDEFGEFWIKGLVQGRKYHVDIGKDGYRRQVSIVTLDSDHDLGDVMLAPI